MFYHYLYAHLLGSISSHDFDLLQHAEYCPTEDIDPRKAHDERVAKALRDIQRVKHHREEASLCYE
ncbi:MAG: hypothetical protein HDS77_07015 [Bacteroidales bacterium]|nr:hypothetical protein [Bacteroidales bacterium]